MCSEATCNSRNGRKWLRWNPKATVLLDVRTAAERATGQIDSSLHIPLNELRDRMDELPKDREIIVHCQSGQRSYFACRILSQRGFRVRNLTGSFRTWKTAQDVLPSAG